MALSVDRKYNFLPMNCILKPGEWDLKFFDVVGNYNCLWFGEMLTFDLTIDNPRQSSPKRMIKMLDVFGILVNRKNLVEYLCVRKRGDDEIQKLFPEEECPYVDHYETITSHENDEILLFNLSHIEALFDEGCVPVSKNDKTKGKKEDEEEEDSDSDEDKKNGGGDFYSMENIDVLECARSVSKERFQEIIESQGNDADWEFINLMMNE